MIEIDNTDARLLALMQQDVSTSNLALAAAAHVSPATALRRTKQLQDRGVIERQVAVLSPDAVGGLQAIVEVSLDRQGEEHVRAFEALAVPEPAVQQCYRVTAGPDFVIVLWVADMAAYQTLVERLFTQNANVRSVKTYFATRRCKFEPAVSLGHLVRHDARHR